jgi:hypothetical protein
MYLMKTRLQWWHITFGATGITNGGTLEAAQRIAGMLTAGQRSSMTDARSEIPSRRHGEGSVLE